MLQRSGITGSFLHNRSTGNDRFHDGCDRTLEKPGVFNLEEMDPDPYMEALNKFGLPWKVVENPVSVDCYKTADPSVHMD